MTKTILIICGGIEATHGIARAREMGLKVVVSDGNPQAPGFKLADGAIVSSTYDAEGTAQAALHYTREAGPIDGVICCGADVPHTVSAVAAKLGLRGLAPDVARAAMDKLLMKEKFAAAGVPIPWFDAVPNASWLSSLVARKGRDFVVKPVDSRGGRGVQRLNSGVDPVLAYERAEAQSPTHRVMVEAFLDGPQVSTESIVLNGVCHTPGFSDRNYEFLERYQPFFIENGGDLPSFLPQAQQDDVKRVVGGAAAALGIDNHNVKGDMVVHQGRAHVIELAARLSGGYFCTREIPLNTGVDFVGCVIRLALGEKVTAADVTPRFIRPVIQRYVFPQAGRVASIRGVDEARRIPGIEEIVVSARAGDEIPRATSSAARAAMILATGDTIIAARESANRAAALIQVETQSL